MNCPTCDTPCPLTFATDNIEPTAENSAAWAHTGQCYLVCQGDGFVHFRAVYSDARGKLELHRLALLDGTPLAEAWRASRAEVRGIGRTAEKTEGERTERVAPDWLG
jgi:hypothetical protein